MQLEDAKMVLRKGNLDLEIVDYKYKQGASENEIVEQSPVAGSQVKEGRKIMLVMNSTNRPVEVIPSVIDNCSLREAEARLKASGFVIEKIITRTGEKDWLYAIKYNDSLLVNGSSVPRGAGLTLVIGRGEENDVNRVVVDEGYFE
jgi:beta-lactam-binding protein with PASTA domain